MAFDLEAEVRDLAARRDIQKAIFAYMRGQDRLDPELQRSAFHEGADLDCGPHRGDPDSYTAFAQGLLGDMAGSQHIVGQIDLDVDADAGRGTGEVYFFAWHRSTENGHEEDLLMAGRYIDEYECRDGKWGISRRRELIDWARTDTAADEVLKVMDTVHLSGRRGTDFSQTRDWKSGTSGR